MTFYANHQFYCPPANSCSREIQTVALKYAIVAFFYGVCKV